MASHANIGQEGKASIGHSDNAILSGSVRERVNINIWRYKTMANKVIHTDRAPAAVGPYVQAIQAGNTLFSSGQLGLIPETGALPEGVEAQTRQSLANIKAILEEAGYDVSDVVKTTVFIKNMGDFAAVNAIYAEFFGDSKPARSCVEVAKLPKDGLVEIEFVAVR